MFLAISKACWLQFRANSPGRAPHPNLTPTLSSRRRGEGRSACAEATRVSLLLNLAPLFAGRGRNSREAGISGEGHGTVLLRIQRSRMEGPLTPTLSPQE